MTKPLKRVGARIIEVCEVVDRLGVCGSGDIRHTLNMDRSNAVKYLQRATGLGLVEVDRTVKPQSYRVVNDWRQMLPRKPEPVRIAVVPMLSGAMMAQSRAFPLAGVWA